MNDKVLICKGIENDSSYEKVLKMKYGSHKM